MPFLEKAPDWENAGIEPPASKRQSGWQVKDKPPAAWLNWFFNRVWKAIKELQEKAVEKVDGKGLSTNDYSTDDKTKLAGIEAGANKYVHPANHPASIITQDASNRFVTDTEKTAWNGKETTSGAQTKADAAQAAANAYADTKTAGINTDTITPVTLQPGQQVITSSKNSRLRGLQIKGKTVIGFDNRKGIIGVDGPYIARYKDNTFKDVAATLAFGGIELHADPADGSDPDILREVDGRYEVVHKYKKIILDGSCSLGLLMIQRLTGYVRVSIDIDVVDSAVFANGGRFEGYWATKYNGESLAAADPFTRPDAIDFRSSYGSRFLLSVANTDSGWGDAYTPTPAEVQAYFNGWRMCNYSNTQLYNGSGTKCWGKLTHPSNTIGSGGWSGSDIVLSVPTSFAGRDSSAAASIYTPYQLLYRLAAPVTETVQPDGALSLVEGDNFVEVGSGYVSREPAPQPIFEVDRVNFGNIFGDIPSGIYAFKHAARKMLAVYGNGLLDPRWVFYNEAITPNGDIAQLIMPHVFDPSLFYSVSYLKRSRSPVPSVSGSLAATEKSQLRDLTDGVTEALRNINANVQAFGKVSPQQTTDNRTYYVRPDGSDNNNGLSIGSAFRTIGKAVSMLPQTINHTMVINVADGTYAEDVSIAGLKLRGSLTLIGNKSNPAAVKVNSLEQYSNFGVVTVEGITATTTTRDAFVINRCVGFRLNGCQAIASTGTYSGVAIYFSNGVVNGGVYSNHLVGVNVGVTSQVQIIGTSGVGNAVGIGANDGAILTKFNVTLTGTTPESVSAGTITSGVLNPWGDNNPNDRSYVELRKADAQTISANVSTKMNFSVKVADTLNEVSNSRFTAKKTGRYHFSCAFQLYGGFAASAWVDVILMVNGGQLFAIRGFYVGDSTSFTLSAPVNLVAGNYLEVFINSSSSGSVGGDQSRSFLSIQREA